MSYEEACIWVARNRHVDWESNFEADIAEAKRLSDPATWPDCLKEKEMSSEAIERSDK